MVDSTICSVVRNLRCDTAEKLNSFKVTNCWPFGAIPLLNRSICAIKSSLVEKCMQQDFSLYWVWTLCCSEEVLSLKLCFYNKWGLERLVLLIFYPNILWLFAFCTATTASKSLHLCSFREIKSITTTKIIPLVISGNDWRVSYRVSRVDTVASPPLIVSLCPYVSNWKNIWTEGSGAYPYLKVPHYLIVCMCHWDSNQLIANVRSCGGRPFS